MLPRGRLTRERQTAALAVPPSPLNNDIDGGSVNYSCKGQSMLSAEELTLWDHVRPTQIDQPLAANHHVCRTRPLLEDDLGAAIAVLKDSTAAIQKQADLVRRHREHQLPDTFKRQPRGLERTTQALVSPIGRKDALELQQLRFALGEEIEALTSSFRSASEGALQIRKRTEQQLAQHLQHDDRELDALQRLALPREAITNSAIDSDWKASRLAKRLVDFTCDEIQCRLDRIYLEQLHGPPTPRNGIGDGPSKEESSLKSDLDSLYAEIRDVLVMSVTHEFESPLLKLSQEDRQRQCAAEELAHQSILRRLSRSRLSLEEAVNCLNLFYSYRASLDDLYVIHQRIGKTVELGKEHDSLFTPVAEESAMKDGPSRVLLRHVGVSDESFTDRRSLEHDLSKAVTKLRAPSFFSPSSADESLRNVLEVNNTSSELLSRTFLRNLEPANAATLATSLEALDNKIGLLKVKAEAVDLSNVKESGKAQKHFLHRWA